MASDPERTRRLICALDDFFQKRNAAGTQSKKHTNPWFEYAKAELIGRGIRPEVMKQQEPVEGYFLTRKMSLVARPKNGPLIMIKIITQSGSVRNNLKNRMTEILGYGINLRSQHHDARLGLLYVIKADDSSLRKNRHSGQSPVDELGTFLKRITAPHQPLTSAPCWNAAALVVARITQDHRVCIEDVDPSLEVTGEFFDRLVASGIS